MTTHIDIVCRSSHGLTAQEIEATAKRLMPELLTDLHAALARNGYPYLDVDDCDMRIFTSSEPQDKTGLELTLYAPTTPDSDDQYVEAEVAVQRRLSNTPLRLPQDAIKVMVR